VYIHIWGILYAVTGIYFLSEVNMNTKGKPPVEAPLYHPMLAMLAVPASHYSAAATPDTTSVTLVSLAGDSSLVAFART